MSRSPIGAVILGLFLISVLPARSAIVVVESLDWVIADSDLVVYGKLVENKRVRDKQKIIWSTVTVEVIDTLKGDKPEKLQFIVAHDSEPPSDRVAELVDQKTETLICLVKSERYKSKGEDYATVPWALRQSQLQIDHTLIDLSDKSGALVVPMDARLLNRKDDILKAAKAAGSASPAGGKLPTQARFRAPASSEPVRKLAAGDAVWIFAPLTPRLEEQGKEWLKTKEIDYRTEGVRLLRSFKSEANETLLKDLLKDSQTISDGKVKRYPVRQAAYEVLREWKVDVPRPVLEE
ncbi:hypothetical protein AYO44_13850 [Planctomycetaceae bacterium SCGC AG-212-F19]|nr:hypothetical protein AYO44_13850 [Planctomycetaceae bacterium SCGC AG-212-F19]